MKKLNIDFLKQELIKEAYDFAGKRPEKAMTSNYKQAKVFMGAYETPIAKETISKIKKGEDVSKKELENTLLAIHIFKKIAASKKKYKVKQEATDILKKNGIDLATRTEDDIKLLKQSEKLFKKKYRTVNPKEETGEAPAIEAPVKEPSVEEPSVEPESEEPEQEVEKPEKKPEPEKKEVSIKAIPARIDKMKIDVFKKFADKFGFPVEDLLQLIESEELDEEEVPKFKIGQIERYLKKFGKTMDALARKAREMPSTAQDRLHSAETEASKSFFRSIRLASPSALGILKGRIQETGKGTIEKVKDISQRASEKIKKSPTAQLAKSKWEQMKEKGSAVYKKAKEYGRQKAGQAFEKVISKAEAKGKGEEETPKQEVPEKPVEEKPLGKFSKIATPSSKKREELRKKFISKKKKPLQLPAPKIRIAKY